MSCRSDAERVSILRALNADTDLEPELKGQVALALTIFDPSLGIAERAAFVVENEERRLFAAQRCRGVFVRSVENKEHTTTYRKHGFVFSFFPLSFSFFLIFLQNPTDVFLFFSLRPQPRGARRWRRLPATRPGPRKDDKRKSRSVTKNEPPSGPDSCERVAHD